MCLSMQVGFHACVMFVRVRVSTRVCFLCSGLARLLSWENRLHPLWTEVWSVATEETKVLIM